MRELMTLGMDVARLNFSHGTHEEHARHIERLRKAAKKERRSVCILVDLSSARCEFWALADPCPYSLLRTSPGVSHFLRQTCCTGYYSLLY
jgi:pyruvate kinase